TAIGLALTACSGASAARENFAGHPLSTPQTAIAAPATASAASLVSTPTITPEVPLPTPTSVRPTPATPPSERAVIQPIQGWHVGGQVAIWTMPNGDLFLNAAIAGPPDELLRATGGPNLMWSVTGGACADETSPLRPRFPPTVLLRFHAQQDEPGHQTISTVIPPTATTLLAFVNGGGPLIACVNLPIHP
ncbi:MAG: hypothetical protein ACR2M3_00860, partial [Thermomicrobiales bacterium]